MTENGTETKRTLSNSEIKQIKALNLSPKQEEVVRNIWSEEKESNSGWLATLIGVIMQIVLLTVFAANFMYHTQMTVAINQIALLLVWVSIAVVFLVGLGYTSLASEKNSAFGHAAMGLMKQNNIILVIFSRICALALIALLAINGHMITAFILIMVSIFVWATGSAAKDRVQQALNKIDAGNKV